MHKKIKSILLLLTLTIFTLLTACGSNGNSGTASQENGATAGLADGIHMVSVLLEGGTGRATVTSPTELTVEKGAMTARIEWSSSHYDYMRIGEEKYLPVNTEGNSVFEIPVSALGEALEMVADTTAMSTPHEITYQLTFRLEGEDTADADSEEEGIAEGEEAGPVSGLEDIIDPKTISKELTYDHAMEILYAKDFQVDYYKDGYLLLQMPDHQAFLILPEGKKAPADLKEGVEAIQGPVRNIYLVASAVMDMFRTIDGLDSIRFSGLKRDNWYLTEVQDAMDANQILYAGKYSAPDYERIMAENCGLVIENTMIYHTPAVMEQLKRFHIPVMVDYSSYEEEPLARMEWVKVYGALTGRDEQAAAVFQGQMDAFDQIAGEGQKDKKVAFFYFTNDGQVNVRKSVDYLPKMIEMAGGTYIFEDLGSEEAGASSTISLPMESFFASAKDADYMIYNSTTVGEVKTLEDLIADNPWLEKCKAVQEKQIFCTSNNLYQSSMELGTIIGDFQKMLQGEREGFTYLYPLE